MGNVGGGKEWCWSVEGWGSAEVGKGRHVWMFSSTSPCTSVPYRVRNLRKMRNLWANFTDFEPKVNIKCKTKKHKKRQRLRLRDRKGKGTGQRVQAHIV